MADIRFVPASTKDFSLSSKNLSTYLDCQLQVAQELLARIYGFADLHEIQSAIGNVPAGPYDDELGFDKISIAFERQSREANIAHSYLADTDQDSIGGGAIDIHSLSLFRRPSLQRAAKRRLAALKGIYDRRCAGKSSKAYCFVGFPNTGGTYAKYLLLTDKGMAVRDALRAGYPLDVLLSIHPHSPQLHAASLGMLLELHGENFDRNSTLAEIKESARRLLPYSTDVISMFESVVGDNAELLPPPEIAGNEAIDAESFPIALYIAASIAYDAQDMVLAEKWLRTLWMILERDGYGSRWLVGPTMLATGRPFPKRFLEHLDDDDFWFGASDVEANIFFAVACRALEKGSWDTAGKAFAKYIDFYPDTTLDDLAPRIDLEYQRDDTDARIFGEYLQRRPDILIALQACLSDNRAAAIPSRDFEERGKQFVHILRDQFRVDST